jgi:hypothetical protein
MMGLFLAGGFSVDLMHHAVHVMGSRILGFSQELFDDTASMPADEAIAMSVQLAEHYPNIAALVREISGGGISHDEESMVGGGPRCGTHRSGPRSRPWRTHLSTRP